MTTSRNKSGVAFWATVVMVVALVAYPLSFGPACWIVSQMPEDPEIFHLAYLPVGRMGMGDLPYLDDAIRWYGMLMMRPGRSVDVYASPDGLNGIIILKK